VARNFATRLLTCFDQVWGAKAATHAIRVLVRISDAQREGARGSARALLGRRAAPGTRPGGARPAAAALACAEAAGWRCPAGAAEDRLLVAAAAAARFHAPAAV
jgi:hypothetical protein